MTDYYDRPEISNSDLNNATWADLQQSRRDRKKGKVKTSEAMEFGKIFHSYVLEDEKEWVDDYHLVCKLKNEGRKNPRATKEYKEWAAEQTLPILNMEQMDCVLHMKQALIDHGGAIVEFMLAADHYEKEYCFTFGGWKLRSKLDAVKDKIGFDLKSIREINPYEIAKAMRKYNRQASFYRLAMADGHIEEAKLFDFYFVFVEKKAPYKVQVVRQSRGAFLDGVDEIVVKLNQFAKDRESPLGYSTEVIEWLGKNEYRDTVTEDEGEALL